MKTKSIITLVFWISILVLFTNFFASCKQGNYEAKKYLPGVYYYEIPSGEVQKLIINTDFKFKQIIYAKDTNRVLYENNGEMFVKGNKIEFKDWLECYELAEQKFLSSPHLVYSIGNYWRRSSAGDGVLIIKFDQSNYIFRKKM